MQRIKLKKYPKTPHLPGSGAVTADDIVLTDAEPFGPVAAKNVIIEEKLDGANVRIRWDGEGDPVLGNREHTLLKGYVRRNTPAKLQFRPLWNWIYDNRERFCRLASILKTSEFTIFAEWLYAEHTVRYDALPELLIPFAIHLDAFRKMLDPVAGRLSLTCAGFQTPPLIAMFDLSMPGAGADFREFLPRVMEPAKSEWSSRNREGIYLKWGDGLLSTERCAKFVHPDFSPVIDFNTRELRRNALAVKP
jgi:hypothetical protein